MLAALAFSAGGTSCSSDPEELPSPPYEVSRQALTEHLRALGHDRMLGTSGYVKAVDYVAGELRAAGWRVRVEDVPATVWRERSPATLEVGDSGPLREVRDFRVPSYSSAGEANGTLRVVDDGCQRSDFDGLAPGQVAFAGSGSCFLFRKTANAKAAGASAMVVQTGRAPRGVPSATLAVPRLGLPVVLMSQRVAARDGDPVRLSVDTASERGVTENVIAEIGPARGPVVMAGAHLDSVPGGPGVNDNGSGVAALLEVARALGSRPPGRVRLGFWGAEEEGLIGSRSYVRGLSKAELSELTAYLNFDMLGSPNAVTSIYSDGDAELGRLLRRVTPGRERGTSTGNRSDHAEFAAKGVPVNGLYTGASEPGPGGRPRDPCYHLPCDTLQNVDVDLLLTMTRAIERALVAQAK